mgnify:CR=1 FL=1
MMLAELSQIFFEVNKNYQICQQKMEDDLYNESTPVAADLFPALTYKPTHILILAHRIQFSEVSHIVIW